MGQLFIQKCKRPVITYSLYKLNVGLVEKETNLGLFKLFLP